MRKIYMFNHSEDLKQLLHSSSLRKALMLVMMVMTIGVGEVWGAWPTYSGSITKSGSTYYVLNEGDGGVELMDGWSHTYDKTYNLGGPCGTLSFQLKKVNAGPTGSVYVYAGSSEVYSVGVGSFAKKQEWKTFPDSPKDIKSYCKETTMRFHATGTLGKWLRYAKVTMFSGTLDPSTSSLQFGAADYNTTGNTSAYKQTFEIDWSNIAEMSISGLDNTQFSASISNNSSVGKYGTATVTVTYKHDKVGTHNATLTIGGKSVSLSGSTNKIPTYVTTDPTVSSITYGETISNEQILTSGLVEANVIGESGKDIDGTWTINEAGQTVTTSGGNDMDVHLTFTPTDNTTYQTVETTAQVHVRSVSTITWDAAYSADLPTIAVNKTISNAATTTAASEATITYTSSNEEVIAITGDGTTFIGVGEGTATITASHGNTTNYGEASSSKTFQTTAKNIQVVAWSQNLRRLTTESDPMGLNAEVWIENPVTSERTYDSERSAQIVYTSNDKSVVTISDGYLYVQRAGETTVVASIEGDEDYEAASVTLPVKVRVPSSGCDDPLLLDRATDGTNDYLYRFFQMNKDEIISDSYSIDVSDGKVPDKLSFSHKGEYYHPLGISSWTYFKGTIKAQQCINGSWSDVAGSSVTPTVGSWNALDNLQLDERATAIRFVRPEGAEGYHYVNNVTVTQKHFIRPSSSSLDFGSTIKVNSSEHKDVTISYSNIKEVLAVTTSNTDLTVDQESIGEECGEYGSTTLRITFKPTTSGEFSENVYVRDAVANTTLTIPVTATVQRADQAIHWEPTTTIRTIDQIALNGTTNGKEHGTMLTITYTPENTNVATISSGVATILTPGSVTITASQNGSTNYEAATPVEKTFTISATDLHVVTEPTISASELTYGQALSTLTITNHGQVADEENNVVAGTWAWQSGSSVLNAGAQTPTLVFTPTTNPAWYSNLTTTANVTINKATPTLSWNGTPSTELAYNATGVSYTATSTSTESSAITYSITAGGDYASIVASTGELTITVPGHEITIQAEQAEGTNFAAPEAITLNVTIGGYPTYTFTNNNGDFNWGNSANWEGGNKPSIDNPDVVINGNVVINTKVTVNSLTINDGNSVTLEVNGKLTVNDASANQSKYGDLIVKNGGDVVLNGALQVNDFAIEAAQYVSGQVENTSNLNINGDAYIDIKITDNDVVDQSQWFGFTVPFPVDVTTGVERFDPTTGDVVAATHGVHYLVAKYNSAKRATSGKGWEYYTGTLQPGVFYFFTVDCQSKIYRFHKAAGQDLVANSSMELKTYASANSGDANWNAVGNPTLQYANASCNVQFAQIFNNNSNAYEVVDMNTASFVVGRPFFVQTGEGTLSIAVANDNRDQKYAPQRVAREASQAIEVTLNDENNTFGDRIYVSYSDEADDTYRIGADLQKAGTSNKVPQLWVDALNMKLCVREAELVNNTAKYPLSLYAPKNGVYTIAVPETSMPEDATLYLTYNGRAIWNLSMSAYELDLEQGTTTGYGLRLVAGYQTPTDIDNVTDDEQQARKVIIDDKVYIVMPDGSMYDMLGKSIKY